MTERDEGALCADSEPVAAEEPAKPAVTVPPPDEPAGEDPPRGGCRTELRGWAGAHLHGAVRPRRRAAGRGRPPGRWC
jgi:hypothetical protein